MTAAMRDGGDSMPERLGWKRFDHICFAVHDAEQAVRFYQKLFGLQEDRWVTSAAEGFRGATLNMPDAQGQFEVLEPYGDASFLHEFLAKRGPGVHHITVEVEDIEQAVAYLREEMGIKPFRGIWSDGEWRQTFIHPRDAGGVLYQLFEWEPGMRPQTQGTG